MSFSHILTKSHSRTTKCLIESTSVDNVSLRCLVCLSFCRKVQLTAMLQASVETEKLCRNHNWQAANFFLLFYLCTFCLPTQHLMLVCPETSSTTLVFTVIQSGQARLTLFMNLTRAKVNFTLSVYSLSTLFECSLDELLCKKTELLSRAEIHFVLTFSREEKTDTI